MVRRYKKYLIIMTFLLVLLATGCGKTKSDETTYKGIATTVKNSSEAEATTQKPATKEESTGQVETTTVSTNTTAKTEADSSIAITPMVTSTVLQTQKPTTVIETTTYQRKHRPLSIRTPKASNRLVSSMNGYNIDYSNTKNGYVMVQNTTGVTTYVQITCNSVMRQYKMQGGSYETYPLTMGNGKYKVQVLQIAANGLGYDKNTIEINVTLENGNYPYLYANSYVSFYNGSLSTQRSYELIYEGADEQTIADRIVDYVAKNVSYDYNKAASVTSGAIKSYVPYPDNTLTSAKGICTDYASLVAAMLRVQGIPCKMVYGYINNGATYHAWNQVYYAGAWHLFDACIKSTGGSASSYVADKEY